MTRISFILSFTLLSVSLFAQTINLKSKDATRLKGKELIVISTGDDLMDEYLKEAVELKWIFNKNVTYMDLRSSNALVKKSPNKYVRLQLQLTQATVVYTENHGIHTFETSRSVYGDMMKVILYEDNMERGKGFEISLPSNASFSRGVAIEAIQRTCSVMNKIEEVGSWNKFFISTKKGGLTKLKDKILLVPMEYLENESDSIVMKEKYPYDIHFVPISAIYEKIEESDDNYAYFLVAEELVNIHVHYVCAAIDSEVLGHYHKVVQLPSTIINGTRHLHIVPKVFIKLFKRLN